MKIAIVPLLAAVSVRALTVLEYLGTPASNTSFVYNILRSVPPSSGSTIFVPTDAVFAALNASHPELFMSTANSTESLNRLVAYHTVPAFNASMLVQTTKSNETLLVAVPAITGGLGLTASVVSTFAASDGTIFVIDALLIPPFPLSATAKYLGWTEFSQIVSAANLGDTLDSLTNHTFFIPTNKAISATLALLADFGFVPKANFLTTLIAAHIADSLLYFRSITKIAQSPTPANRIPLLVPGNSLSTRVTADLAIELKVQANALFPPAKIIHGDILVQGGVVQMIDAVIIPTTASLVESFLAPFSLVKA